MPWHVMVSVAASPLYVLGAVKPPPSPSSACNQLMALATIPDIIDDIRAGKMVVLMDDEDRENEGDLIIAAEKVTPEIINFMATEACGLICMPITPERARQLNLPLMVRDNRSQHETNFT